MSGFRRVTQLTQWFSRLEVRSHGLVQLDEAATLRKGNSPIPQTHFACGRFVYNFLRRYSDGDVEKEVNSKISDSVSARISEPTKSEYSEHNSSNPVHIGYKVLGRLGEGELDIKPVDAFAIVRVGSHQFKVTCGDTIYVEKLKFTDINDRLSLNKVLLLGSKSQTVIGRPTIPKAAVIAAVEEQALDAKVIIFKKKRRKNYRRHRGHRQELTRLRILDILGPENFTAEREDTEIAA